MSTELVAIELRLKGYEGVMSDMRMLDTMLNNLRGRKNKVEIQNNLAKAKKDIIAYNAELERLKKLQKNIQTGMSNGSLKNPAWGKRLAETSAKIAETTRKLKEARQAANEFQYALKNFSPVTFGQAFGKITSWVAHAGSAMQSFGNALTKLTSPFRRFTTGLIYSAGYKMLNTVLEGFGGAFERYDTMQNYAKSLKALGLDADETFKVFANQDKPLTAIDNLNEAVLGLPTGLDEIVAAQKVYAGATGEMVKSTKAAIAANNTFLASGMGAREQRFMQRYLVSLASGAELTTMQWQSMGRIAPLAMRAVAKELKYADDEYAKFNDDVQKGRVSGEEFLEAFIKVGTEGKVQAAANVMKTTYEGLVANIQNATKRMGEGVLKMLDEVFKTYNGRNLVQNLLGFDAEGNEVGGGIKHFINSISDGLQGWVKAHPEEILKFFDAIKSIDWKGLIRGVGEGFLELAHLTEKIAGMLEGKDLSEVGKFMVMGNIWGRALTIAGGLVKGTRHIWGFLGATAVIAFLKAKGFSKYGLLGMLGKFIGGTAEGAAETATVASTTARTAPKMGKIATGLSAVFKGWAQIATMIGGSAFVAWGSMKLFKGAVKSFKETVDILNTVDWEMGAKALEGIAVFLGGMTVLSVAVSKVPPGLLGDFLFGEVVAGLFTSIALAFVDFDMALIRGSLKKANDALGYINPIIDKINNIKEVGSVNKENIRNAIEAFNEVTKTFKGDFNVDSKQWENGLMYFDKKYSNSLRNIKNAIKSINEIAKMKVSADKIEELTEPLGDALQAINTMLETLPEGLGSKGTAENVTNLNTTMTNLRSAFGALVGKRGILSQITEVTEKVKEMTADPELDKLNEFRTAMGHIGEALSSAYESLNSGIGNGEFMASNMNNIREALKQVRLAIHHLNEIGNTEVNENGTANIKAVVQSLKNAFNAEDVAAITTQIDAFVTSIKDALQTVTDLGAEPIELDIQFKLSSGFYSSKQKVISEIKSAKKEINSQKSPISFSIPVRVFFSVITNLGSALAKITSDRQEVERQATGASTPITPHISTGGWVSRQGVLYRSGGGSIFKPRGTDKIPAMLSEGEYVQRKQATDFWGVDFMRKVNAMDVRGAMQAMLTKAGNATSIGRQSIFNNTVNNNQRITQNINTNNPSFARMQVGRFAGAL